MNKCLYITLQPIEKGDGASDKAFAQRNAITKIGIESHIAYLKNEKGKLTFFIDGTRSEKITRYGDIYTFLFRAIDNLGINILYIRYVGMACYKFNKFLKMSKAKGIRIYLEIPTYPYDGELVFTSPRLIYRMYRERFFRRYLRKYIYRIVTSSLFDEIFSTPTIKISNAPARHLPISKGNVEIGSFKMIAVANLAFWHGYDRLIRGMANYYEACPDINVYLTIAGEGDPIVNEELKTLVKNKGLTNYVFFVGQKTNGELDEYFDNAQIAIGCLGCHRKKINEVKSLKNVEYAMRGVPFVYSESNSDFDNKPYVYRLPADESDIDIKSLVLFVNNLNMTAEEISENVSDFTWENQMRKVFEM